ncbi:hypothetical protein [Lysobacter enzymogenes]|uniref:hypothetical protein n=1 Tax=Lysobacter enzymogenes TaxID=69 RepID=UPI001AF6233D|nr:hypothetical protein [Lysobacter enzymogenes]QQQ04093.1 hypothetical protein JHW41_11390 [Lysobacter enzymogenes]
MQAVTSERLRKNLCINTSRIAAGIQSRAPNKIIATKKSAPKGAGLYGIFG